MNNLKLLSQAVFILFSAEWEKREIMINILCILKYHLLRLSVTPDILYDLRVDPCNIYMNHDIIRFCAENLLIYWKTRPGWTLEIQVTLYKKDDIFRLRLCLKKRLYLEDYTKLAENYFRNGNYDKFCFRKVYFKGFLNNWIFFDFFTLFPP